MYTFEINHISSGETTYSNISCVKYFIAGMEQIVENDDIGTHAFPTTSDLYLFSDKESYTIACADISTIHVKKDNS